MRLDELIGIKKYKDYDVEDEDIIVKHMMHLGLKHLGSGSSGHVFLDKSGNAVKLYSPDDVCYTAFVEYCQKHSSVHLPKIISKKIRLANKDYYMVRFERLHPIQDYDTRATLYVILNIALSSSVKDYQSLVEQFETVSDTKYIDFIKTNQGLLEELLNIAKEMPDECVLDLDIRRNQNIMQRDSEFVVVDPWA